MPGVSTPQENATTESSAQQTTDFAQAIAVATSEAVDDDAATYLPLESYIGSTFSPSADENRAVVVYNPLNENAAILRVSRTGTSESQGGFIKNDELLSNFGLDVSSLNKHTQASLIMTNGKTLIGYVAKSKSRVGFYFPKKLAEQTLSLPPSGQRLPIRVRKLIIG